MDDIHITWAEVASALALGCSTLAGLLWGGSVAKQKELTARLEVHEKDTHSAILEKMDEHADERRIQLEGVRLELYRTNELSRAERREDNRLIHTKIDEVTSMVMRALHSKGLGNG